MGEELTTMQRYVFAGGAALMFFVGWPLVCHAFVTGYRRAGTTISLVLLCNIAWLVWVFTTVPMVPSR